MTKENIKIKLELRDCEVKKELNISTLGYVDPILRLNPNWGRRPFTYLSSEEKKLKKLSNLAADRSAYIDNAPKVFTTVLNELALEFQYDTQQAIEEVITFHDNLIKNHRVKEGTARFNMIRLYSVMLLEGQNPEPLS